MKFRTLKPSEIDVRVARATAKGAQFLLYKDARCDMNILDETVGAENWQRKHDEHNGNLFCSVGIYDAEFDRWVWKEDAGSESNTEAEKGHASDSFKRACVNWGIGRELYTSPFIWLSGCTEQTQNGKYVPKKEYNGLRVVDVAYDENRSIKYIAIADKSGNTVYESGAKETVTAICEECGREVVSVTKLDGSVWAVADMARWSKGRFQKVLCGDCMKKAQKKEKS